MLKHPITDSREHKRGAARTADRYFADMKKRESRGQADETKEMARARKDARLEGMERLNRIQECEGLIRAAMKPKATPSDRAEAGNAIICLTSMAKRIK